MATYVLVHGGGHGGWCYAKVKRLLEGDGHEVFAPSLTGLGEHAHLVSPQVDLDMHIDDVVRLLHSWDLREVILVGHSYGGMVITGVGGRAADRIGKLVFLDAANPCNGQSLVDEAGEMMAAARKFSFVVEGVELVLSPELEFYYGVEDPADQAWMRERLTPHPWKCFEQPLNIDDEAAFAAIEQFHIVCTETIRHREKRHPDVMARAREQHRLWAVDTGHDLMITEPEFVARTLEEIAALS